MNKKLNISKEFSEIIIIEKRKNALTTSRNVSERFNKKHDYVLRCIKNLDCTENFRSSNFAESNYQDSRGKLQPEYLMTREGFMFLVMKFTGKEATLIKEAYINKFKQMEELIQHKQTQTYIEARKDSKLLQKSTMDVVKTFVDYAKLNGSNNADRYYIIYNKLINNVLGIGSNDLDKLDSKQLLMRSKILDYIAKNIKIDIEKDLYYKDIYKDCRSKLESMIDFIRI